MERVNKYIVLVLFALVGFSCTTAWAGTVVMGSDYFATAPGSAFNFGGTIGVVNFMGNPTGPGNTDTIVQRQSDAVINGDAIKIQLVQLSMESVAPVNIGGSFFDVFVTLDPAELGRDIGSMSIMGDTTGGTFNSSFFDIFFKAHFANIGSPANSFDVFSSVQLSQTGALWGPTPPPNAVIVPGALGDQNANLHSGLGTGQVDFFLMGQASEDSSGQAHHVVVPATTTTTTPEPASMWLMGAGLLGLSALIRRRR
jgi:PEP-CTERM motif